MSFWRDVWRAMGRSYRCPQSKSFPGRAVVRCDLDFGHRGDLHQHEDATGWWVWVTDSWSMTHLERSEI